MLRSGFQYCNLTILIERDLPIWLPWTRWAALSVWTLGTFCVLTFYISFCFTPQRTNWDQTWPNASWWFPKWYIFFYSGMQDWCSCFLVSWNWNCEKYLRWNSMRDGNVTWLNCPYKFSAWQTPHNWPHNAEWHSKFYFQYWEWHNHSVFPYIPVKFDSGKNI